MDWGNLSWIIFVACIAMASMINRYQWRKAWEAYYKRPLREGQTEYKSPDGRNETEEEKD